MFLSTTGKCYTCTDPSAVIEVESGGCVCSTGVCEQAPLGNLDDISNAPLPGDGAGDDTDDDFDDGASEASFASVESAQSAQSVQSAQSAQSIQSAQSVQSAQSED